jgi:hypothetical protein
MYSYKCLSVIYHSRRFIFVRIAFGNNNREVYTTSSLKLHEGNFFLKVNLLLVIVPLRVTVNFFVHTKTQAMIGTKHFLTMLSGKYAP